MGLVVAIDIGKGTEDVLIWDKSKIDKSNFENTIQIVAPSKTNMMNRIIQTYLENFDDLYIKGEIMAGEPWNRTIYKYLEKNPEKVHITENAAMSLRYNLDQVRNRGLIIYNEEEFDQLKKTSPVIRTQDIAWSRIINVIENTGYTTSDIDTVLICCQDHGNPKDQTRSSRDFRMSEIYSILDETGRLEDLLYDLDDISPQMPRHKAVAQSAQRQFPHLNNNQIMVMDSSPAVILGVLDYSRQNQLIINVGNGHTIMIAMKDHIVEFVYEFHTSGISNEQIMNDLRRIIAGELTHDQSLNEGGHGIYIRNKSINTISSLDNYLPITLIGPNRQLLQDLDAQLAHPIGNMMMAGPYGLIRAYLDNQQLFDDE